MENLSQKAFDVAFERSAVVQYPNDCARICAIAATVGLTITVSQAEAVWVHFSDSSHSGWLTIGEEAEVLRAIEMFIADHRR